MSKSSSFALKIIVGGVFATMFIIWLIMFHPVVLISCLALVCLVGVYCVLFLAHRIFIEKNG